jgi:23S rRNA (guanine2445-N2)-methyltransferase / 23S rRNA (guanine2069-N7)-methyltransferase
MLFPIFVSCPKGLENLLTLELEALGLENVKNNPQGVYGDASLETIYQIALWSRLANRVHFVLFNGPASKSQDLYQTCQQFQWQTVFSGEQTLKVQFHGVSEELRNEMYSAQVVKDAIVDHFRTLSGQRPQIDKRDANVQVHAYLKHDQVTVSLDLVGYSLHQRGYRLEQGAAPLKENVAAGLLWRMNWPQIAAQGGHFADLMCGSGTIVIEAAMIALRMAPGLLREDQGFSAWLQHDPLLWEQCRQTAHAQRQHLDIRLFGSDANRRVLDYAKANARRAGVDRYISWGHQPIRNSKRLHEKGLILMNPPYGERLGEQMELIPLYQEIGEVLHKDFQGWEAGILTSDPMLAKALGLRAHKNYSFYNGSIPCQLYCVRLDETNQLRHAGPQKISESAQMFANRLKKNAQNLKKWAERHGIECYRVYDADLPEYAFAIDKYGEYLVLQEYMPPKSVPEHVASMRRLDVMAVVPEIFGVSPNKIVVKQRKPQKTEQYQKYDDKKERIVAREGFAKFYLNLHDYLDTGIFLDHRLLRLEFAHLNPQTRFLNLFCYTGTASVHAALSGAMTTNVDLSNTYLNWAKENFTLNQLPLAKHEFIQSEVMEWLKTTHDKFDVIYMDAPSFSNSKRMQGTLDIQRDHEPMIRFAMRHLAPGGKLYFSTHLRTFKLDERVKEYAYVTNMSHKTIDMDFKRDLKIHQCYMLESLDD